MKLADWLHARRLTPEQLRRMLGVKNRSSILRYLTGDRIPHPRLIQKIADVTQGMVTLADFLDPSPPRCAVVVDDEEEEPKLVFPWTRGDAYQKAVQQSAFGPEPGVDILSDPVIRALETLGRRAKFTRRGKFLLDGRVSDAKRVVSEANKVLAAEGLTLIAYPGLAGDDR